MMDLNLNQYLELLVFLLSLIYLILLVRENIWCWPFAIMGSIVSIYLFIDAKLYSEAILYFFYAVMGFYGWWNWYRPKTKKRVSRWRFITHIPYLVGGIAAAVGLGWLFREYTDAQQPYADAASTSFSFIATFMEAHKVLDGWYYWIAINFFSVWLYHSRGLDIYAVQMVLFGILSIVGFISWRRSLLEQK